MTVGAHVRPLWYGSARIEFGRAWVATPVLGKGGYRRQRILDETPLLALLCFAKP
jgi:hypothetical protein